MATSPQIREHYDSLAFIYRTFWGDHIHHGLFTDSDGAASVAQTKLLDHCVALLGDCRGLHVLDAGCGHGGTIIYLTQNHHCRCTGITLSPKQARIAHNLAAEAGLSLNLAVADADQFVFPGSHFELVWAMESSEHFLDKGGFIANVARTLRPGGQFLLAAWTGSMESSRVREVAERFLCPELWSAEQYRSTIEGSGLKITHVEDLTSRVMHTWEICEQRAHAVPLAVKLLPRAAREFVEGISVILDAYRSGELTYTIMTARK
jgi:cyclopropane fatty-acyl-phospholipid synthase-like methyltransferase